MKRKSLQKYLFSLILFTIELDFVLCARIFRNSTDSAWPIIYESSALSPLSNILYELQDAFVPLDRDIKENEITPNVNTAGFKFFGTNSSIYEEAAFSAHLTKASNCRNSLDKWDCKECLQALPDGIVVRWFMTQPLGVTGMIVKSKARKAIYVILRGASSFSTKMLFLRKTLIDHPTIPGAKVQAGALASLRDISGILHGVVGDQLKLHPDYNVFVLGHSYGASLGSLVAVDLYQHIESLNSTNLFANLLGKQRVGDYYFAKYIQEHNIQIRRFVNEADNTPHRPEIKDGYVNEGDEYWLTQVNNATQILYCPGPFETRNCSNSLNHVTGESHLKYFDVYQGCGESDSNIIRNAMKEVKSIDQRSDFLTRLLGINSDK